MDHTLTGSLPVPRPRTDPEPADPTAGFDHAAGVPEHGLGVPPSWFTAALQSDAATHLARGRLRSAVALDVVTFTAACPACGQDAEWTEEREDTRLRARVACPCPG